MVTKALRNHKISHRWKYPATFLVMHNGATTCLNTLEEGKSTHKINLFADYIILPFTNPDASLAEAFQIFTQISHISYYKVNANKSLIMDQRVQFSTKLNLQS